MKELIEDDTLWDKKYFGNFITILQKHNDDKSSIFSYDADTVEVINIFTAYVF